MHTTVLASRRWQYHTSIKETVCGFVSSLRSLKRDREMGKTYWRLLDSVFELCLQPTHSLASLPCLPACLPTRLCAGSADQWKQKKNRRTCLALHQMKDIEKFNKKKMVFLVFHSQLLFERFLLGQFYVQIFAQINLDWLKLRSVCLGLILGGYCYF